MDIALVRDSIIQIHFALLYCATLMVLHLKSLNYHLHIAYLNAKYRAVDLVLFKITLPIIHATRISIL